MWATTATQNSPASLLGALERGFGLETDIRDLAGELVVSHDPPSPDALPALGLFAGAGSALAESSGTIALNVKADGLGPMLPDLLSRLPQGRFFLFDMSWPELLSFVEARLPVALRVSEWEPLDATLFARLDIPVRVWLDSFGSDWFLDDPAISELCRIGQVAVVSPEIHGRDPRAVWDWFGGQVRGGADILLCTDRADEVVSLLT